MHRILNIGLVLKKQNDKKSVIKQIYFGVKEHIGNNIFDIPVKIYSSEN
jgi:hypothetical protein